MKNKGEYKNLHISPRSLDEMYTTMHGTSAKIFMLLLVPRFKNNSEKRKLHQQDKYDNAITLFVLS
jgi:hypothetical protein